MLASMDFLPTARVPRTGLGLGRQMAAAAVLGPASVQLLVDVGTQWDATHVPTQARHWQLGLRQHSRDPYAATPVRAPAAHVKSDNTGGAPSGAAPPWSQLSTGTPQLVCSAILLRGRSRTAEHTGRGGQGRGGGRAAVLAGPGLGLLRRTSACPPLRLPRRCREGPEPLRHGHAGGMAEVATA